MIVNSWVLHDLSMTMNFIGPCCRTSLEVAFFFEISLSACHRRSRHTVDAVSNLRSRRGFCTLLLSSALFWSLLASSGLFWPLLASSVFFWFNFFGSTVGSLCSALPPRNLTDYRCDAFLSEKEKKYEKMRKEKKIKVNEFKFWIERFELWSTFG